MRIAYLLGSLNRGGTETLLLDTFRQAKKTGLDIAGIYRKEGSLFEDFKHTGISLFQVYPRNWFDVFYLFRLRKLLKREKIKIAHAQQPIDALYAYLACFGLKIKVVLTLHGYGYRYSKFYRLVLKFMLKRTDLNLFVSKSQQTYYSEKYVLKETQKLKVLYNGISFDKFRHIQYRSIREEFSVTEDCLLLGSVGNFNAVRDQMTICRFLKLLKKQNINFAFVFAGAKINAEARYMDDCIKYCDEQGLNSKVFFPGPRNDIPNLLNQLDAFIYSTDHDTFGIAVIEAMYAGIPVFVNDWSVMAEITEEGKHATLYRSKDEEDLFDHFARFLANKEKFIQKAKEDAKWAGEEYSIENHLNNLIAIYNEIQ
ncbi:MAG: glycosyltransferase family 4 protein [Bacteroidales bacterium]|nr:glycosyltransferase family 4 protein [Bacteroidales bacterium]